MTTTEILAGYKAHTFTPKHGKVFLHPDGHVLMVKTDSYGTKVTWQRDKTFATGSYDGKSILQKVFEFHARDAQ